MIVKCPKCKNIFLAPDDLQEGQKLKCGSCEYQWQLKQVMNEIPDSIKPSKSDTESSLSKNSKHPILKEISTTIFVLLLIILVLISLRKEIASFWAPSAKVFNSVGLEVPMKGEGLEFKEISSEVIDDMAYISGVIVNTSKNSVIVPPIKIGNQIYVRANKAKLNPQESSKFEAILTDLSSKEIEISF